MSECTHPRTGLVTSRPGGPVDTDLPFATSRVCDLPDCIAEAKQWVTRMTYGKPAYHVLDCGHSVTVSGRCLYCTPELQGSVDGGV